jgi:hypothetical protein
MDTALKELAGSGALGAIMAAVIALCGLVVAALIWMLKRMVDASLAERVEFGGFMKALTASLNGLGLNFQANRSDTMAAVRDVETNVKAEVQHVVWAAHDKQVLLHDKALSAAVNLLSTEITGAAQSIRASNADLLKEAENQRLHDRVEELSRPHDTGCTPRPVRG